MAHGTARGGEGWRAVRLLSVTSLLADVSGEMVMAVLPFLLVSQGAGGLAIGLVGSASEGVGHFSKWLGGRWGDRVRHKRALVASGYLLAALSRFGIALGSSWPASLFWRASDRVGKGLRTAPRDAMLAGAVPPQERNRAFGYHRAADTLGAVIGVLAARQMLSWWHADPTQVVLAAAVVGLVAVVPLLRLREPDTPVRRGPVSDSRPARGFRLFLAASCVFAVGQVSYLFYLLRAGSESGLLAAVSWYLLFNVVYAAAAYPFGILADRWSKAAVLVTGVLLTALASLLAALEPTPFTLLGAFATLGLAFAAAEGTGRVIAADLAGSRTSTHLGTYHAAIGVAGLVGGLGGGYLLDRFGAAILFQAGAAVVLVAALTLLAWERFARQANAYA